MVHSLLKVCWALLEVGHSSEKARDSGPRQGRLFRTSTGKPHMGRKKATVRFKRGLCGLPYLFGGVNPEPLALNPEPLTLTTES